MSLQFRQQDALRKARTPMKVASRKQVPAYVPEIVTRERKEEVLDQEQQINGNLEEE